MKKYFMQPYMITYSDMQERKHQEHMDACGKALILTLGIVLGIVLIGIVY